MFDRFGLLQSYVAMSPILQINKNTLYLGDYYAALDRVQLKVQNVKTVISIVQNIDFKYTDIDHYVIYLADDEEQNISQYFERTFQWIDQGLQNGSVLVHCMMGISRSTTIVISYIMHKYSHNYAKAYNIVRKQRPIIRPNQGFRQQLKALKIQPKHHEPHIEYPDVQQRQKLNKTDMFLTKRHQSTPKSEIRQNQLPLVRYSLKKGMISVSVKQELNFSVIGSANRSYQY